MKSTYQLVAGLSAVFLASAAVPAVAAPAYFSNSSNANVLREYNLITRTNIPGNGTNSGTGGATISGRIAANDGSGWNDESNTFGGPSNPTASVTHTWSLAGPRIIGSYSLDFGTHPENFVVEYQDVGGNWQAWDSVAIVNDNDLTRTPGPKAAIGVRYTATNPTAANILRLNEMQVYLQPGQNVPNQQGFSWFKDIGTPSVTNRLAAETKSSNGNNWWTPNGGDASTLHNGSLSNNDELKSQRVVDGGFAPDGSRAFVRYTFNDFEKMDFGVIGGRNGQGWDNWEVYTNNAAVPTDPQTIVTNTAGGIQANGWTLQYQQNTGVVGNFNGFKFDFLQPGQWKNLLVVWTSQHGAMNELEIYAVPEPTSMAAMGLGALMLGRRRRRI